MGPVQGYECAVGGEGCLKEQCHPLDDPNLYKNYHKGNGINAASSQPVIFL